MALSAAKEIFSDPDNQFLLGQDNLFNYQYKRTKVGNIELNIRDGLYSNTRLEYITFGQSDSKKTVLSSGNTVSFNVKQQPLGAIESIKYHFELFNNKATVYNIDNIFELIEYVEIFNNNKSVEKIDQETLHIFNQLQIRQNSSTIQLANKGLSVSNIAANTKAEWIIDIPCFLTKQGINFSSLGDLSIDIKFMPDRVNANVDDVQLTTSELFVYYYEVIERQDNYMKSLKSIDNRYLQIDHACYYYENVTANAPFKFKLTQEAVTPFILFYVQTKDDSDSFSNKFNNFLSVSQYDLVGKSNQSVMNNVTMTKVLNRDQLVKHFPEYSAFMSSTTAFYDKLFLLNFCLNPQLALKNEYVGGQYLEDNQYELKLTMPANQSSIAIHVFVFKYQMSHIENKTVTFYDR